MSAGRLLTMRSCGATRWQIVRTAAYAALLLLSGSCTTLGYYGQAARGEAAMLLARHPLAQVASDPRTPAPTARGLRLIVDAREFAARELMLPVHGKFDTYVDLGRNYAVWNVYAAPPLSLELRRWCYPIAGCAVYRGYFAEAAAREYAAQLRAAGADAYVSGIIAYSTLGWFDDPVLNTFVGFNAVDLPGLIFHELAHGRVYVPGDSRFNESFATFVEEEGLERWFALRREPAALAAYHRNRELRSAFLAFVLGWRGQFQALYQSTLPAAEQLRRKDDLIAALRAAYHAPETPFRGRYDGFFGAGFNNARLATVATYHDWVPALRALRSQVSDWAAFYRAVDALARLPAAEREQRLLALAGSDSAGHRGATAPVAAAVPGGPAAPTARAPPELHMLQRRPAGQLPQ